MTSALPRAFLSHSSLDANFVSQVFKALGPTLAELDQATFEPGLLTQDAILRAFQRCSLFVLFASANSLRSDWVAKEINEALKRVSDRRLLRILVYCADKATFRLLDPALKQYNIVRIEKSPAVCARQIRGILAEISADSSRTELFIARDENLADLKRLVIDPSKNYRTIAISGFERLGRRALVNRFCRDVYGSFNPPTKSIVVDGITSPDDLFRQLLRLQHETLDRTELISKLSIFSSKSIHEQLRLLGVEIRSIYNQREFLQFIDEGGIISDDGDFSPLFQLLLSQNSDVTDLIHLLILYRNPPSRVHSKYKDVAFYRLPPLTDSQAEVSLLYELKRRHANLPRERVVRLVAACDGHPSNLDYVVGYIFDGNALNPVRLEEVVSGSREFTEYKRERATSYVSKFPFSELEKLLIAALISYRGLPAETLTNAAALRGGDPKSVGDALARLFELNIIDSDGTQYRLIRPLRDALERDERFELTKAESDALAKMLVEIMESYGDEDNVPVALIEPTTVAAIRQGNINSGWARQLVLPSHYIWLARAAYHRREYRDALRFAQMAQSLSFTMTDGAKLHAFRFAGLASARLGMREELDQVVSELGRIKGDRAEGNRHFLLGFAARLRGDLRAALTELRKANLKLRGSIDVQRELIGVHLARAEYSEALEISEALVSRAEDNPYALDGYLQAKIATTPSIEELDYDAAFCSRLLRLEEVGDGPGMSFFRLRKSDIALRKGQTKSAVRFADQAVRNTPNLPAAHAARARALMADGKFDLAWDAVRAVEEIGNKPARIRDGLENLMLYQLRFELNQSRRRFDLCKKDVENMMSIDPELAKMMKRDLAYAISKAEVKLKPAMVDWLKK